MGLGLTLVASALATARDAETVAARERARVQGLYLEAREDLASARTNVTFAWNFARACFNRAEYATNTAERALLAEEGIETCRRTLTWKPDSAPLHYYLALNLGQLARTKTLGALRLVPEIEAAFKAALERDEDFEFAGPDRSLGLLYFEAPGWPTSVGSRTKARHHLHRAVELAPNHPDNRLCLLEACLHWGDRVGVERELKAIAEIWPGAKTQLAGETWAAAWRDWEKRLAACKRKAKYPPATFVSPREQD